MSSLRVLKTARSMIPRRSIHSTPIRRLHDLPKDPATAPSENGAVHALLTQALLRIGELSGKIEHNEEVLERTKGAFSRFAEQQNLQNKENFEVCKHIEEQQKWQYEDAVKAWADIEEVRTRNLELEIELKSIRDQRHQQPKKEDEKKDKIPHGWIMVYTICGYVWIDSLLNIWRNREILQNILHEEWQKRAQKYTAQQQAQNTKDQTTIASQKDVEPKVLESPKEIEVQEPLESKQPEETAEDTTDKDSSPQRCGMCFGCLFREARIHWEYEEAAEVALEIQPIPDTSGTEYDLLELAERALKVLHPELETQKVADSHSPVDAEDEKEGAGDKKMAEREKMMEEPDIKNSGSRFGVRKTIKWLFGF